LGGFGGGAAIVPHTAEDGFVEVGFVGGEVVRELLFEGFFVEVLHVLERIKKREVTADRTATLFGIQNEVALFRFGHGLDEKEEVVFAFHGSFNFGFGGKNGALKKKLKKIFCLRNFNSIEYWFSFFSKKIMIYVKIVL
jgi:hypothetical protein